VNVLAFVLAADPAVAPVASMAAWWARHPAVVARAATPFEHAVLGGFAADRLGYAFASGYQAALRQLAPDLPASRLASLCVTERGGGHPRAIEARLTHVGDGFYLSGTKRWATLSDVAGVLLVAATLGPPDERGRPQIRVVRVDAAAPGVQITPMPSTPFTPEILHGEVRLDEVRVAATALLPGDGYARYIKPFRTIEDLHIQGALFGFLLAAARRLDAPRALLERLAAQLATLGALAARDPSDAGVHVALAGALRLAAPLVAEIEAAWALAGDASHALWQRDRLLLGIAENARAKRLERAWARLAEGGEAPIEPD
jgi:alkylation response protein AidB-like acyl-CoA dehydrogenase